MKDERINLKEGTQLNIGDGRKVTIIRETGRGAGCIVYDAEYIDHIGAMHKIRVKECYPNYLMLEREKSGDIIATESERGKFDEAKKRFVEAYSRNAKIRNTSGLVNSTVNINDMFQKNQTYYTIMSFDEGVDYREYKDHSLKELFEHVRSLAKLIKKYHENGYLHLDIKPENVLVIPETEEHVLLFDFDSVITFEELKKNAQFRLPFSHGFSAPEQIQGKLDRIGCHTDIFGIGALTFYKVFDRIPELKDCKISAEYDFSDMKYIDKRFQPKLYRKTTEFFKKSLSVSILSRWNSLNQVMEAMDELVLLSDVERVFACDSFQYNSGCFIGREEQIEELHRKLHENQVVFLSGIGGIGKTEIAGKYAQMYRAEYDTIVFSMYESSIQNLLNHEILVNGIRQEEGENDESYFERKLDVLKEVLTSNDLIILDNFDVDYDENLERIFECPCKFIVTTREDFADYNYPQINIDKMENMDDIMTLFDKYNACDYDEKEKDAVRKIIILVESHTMTVELIAKYLRVTLESPTEVYNRFLEKEGIANTDETAVKQRKDHKLRAENINNHIRILFDISNFTSAEKEWIRSLSLLGRIRISKTKFQELCNMKEDINALDNLIKRGWIEYDTSTAKVSLHQIIQDLVYNDLKPNAQNCPNLVTSMISLINAETANYSERQRRLKVMNIFMERLTGESLLYAELCVNYGKEKYFGKAEEICLKSPEKKAFDLLQKMYRKKMGHAADCGDMMEMLENGMDMDVYCRYKIAEIIKLFDKAVNFCKRYSDAPDYIAKTYTEIGMETDAYINRNMFFAETEPMEELDKLYYKIMDILESATENILTAGFPTSEKVQLLEKIRDFYSGEDITALYRCEYFTDTDKASWYQEQINRIRQTIEEDDVSRGVYLGDLTNSDIASGYEDKGDYGKALEYYERAYNMGEDTYDQALFKMANVCKKAGDTQKATEYLKRILDIDKEYFSYTSYACCELIKILISEQQFSEAENFSLELIHYNKSEALEEKQAYYVNWMIVAYYSLYMIEKYLYKKNNYWKECVKYYKILDQEEKISDDIYDFVLDYVKSLDVSEKYLKEVLLILKRMDSWQEEKTVRDIYEYVIDVCEQDSRYAQWHVYFLVQYSRYLNRFSQKHCTEAFYYCEMAQKCYEAYQLQDPYYQSLIYKNWVECKVNMDEYDFEQVLEIRKKCDYALIVEREAEEFLYSEEEKCEAWKNAADAYDYTDNFDKKIYCLQKAMDIILPPLHEKEYGEYQSYWSLAMDMLRCHITLGNHIEAYMLLTEIYGRTLYYYGNIKRDAHEWSWKFKELAESLEKLNKADEAANLYLYAMYVMSSPAPDISLMKNLSLDEQTDRMFYEQLRMAITDGLENDTIDAVAEWKEKVIPLLNQRKTGSLYVELLMWFGQNYQDQEVEFKR